MLIYMHSTLLILPLKKLEMKSKSIVVVNIWFIESHEL